LCSDGLDRERDGKDCGQGQYHSNSVLHHLVPIVRRSLWGTIRRVKEGEVTALGQNLEDRKIGQPDSGSRDNRVGKM
jgi:hypothetical protein